MGEPTKRAWSRPELIVLVRSGPEEAVLDTCKNDSPAVAAPETDESSCRSTTSCGLWCDSLHSS